MFQTKDRRPPVLTDLPFGGGNRIMTYVHSFFDLGALVRDIALDTVGLPA